jgi:hypothetical protein
MTYNKGMEKIVHIDEKGRKYDALKSESGMVITIGPHEGVVDALGLPEPFATSLHNVLHARGILNYKDACKPQNLQGALQEALLIDAQRLNEAYFRYEQQDGGTQ